MSRKKKELFDPTKVEILDIPEDEIWTYEIEGLQKPRIIDKSIPLKVKAGIIALLVIAISLSIFMSIRAVSNDEFRYGAVDSGWELVKYTNVDGKKEVTVDFVDGDKGKPVTELHEYAFNCDETIETINIGKDVCLIDGKSFFSCKALRNIFVDEDNPCYCDIDGVLFNKDCTELICFPISHCLSLTEKAGYPLSFPDDGSILPDDFRRAVKVICDYEGDSKAISSHEDKSVIDKFCSLTGLEEYAVFMEKYIAEVATYKIPESVNKIGKLAFAYSDLYSVEIPVGVKTIETMAFFRMDYLDSVVSYKADKTFASLPEGLEIIGSDCFSFDRELTYMFIPGSVKTIGHHAFYSTCWKDDGELRGITEMNVALSEEDFAAKTDVRESWLPKYDSGLFKKNIEINYSCKRNEG